MRPIGDGRGTESGASRGSGSLLRNACSTAPHPYRFIPVEQACPRSTYASVRLAWAAISREAKSRRWSLGKAAAAIMAALSVERPGEGKYTG